MTIYLYTTKDGTKYTIDSQQRYSIQNVNSSPENAESLTALKDSTGRDFFSFENTGEVKIGNKTYALKSLKAIEDQAMFYFDDGNDKDTLIDHVIISPGLLLAKISKPNPDARDSNYEKEILNEVNKYLRGFLRDKALNIAGMQYQDFDGNKTTFPEGFFNRLKTIGDFSADPAFNNALTEIHQIARTIRKHNPNNDDDKNQLKTFLDEVFKENYILSKNAFKDIALDERINYILALDALFSQKPSEKLKDRVLSNEKSYLLDTDTLHTFNPNNLPRINSPQDWSYYLKNIQAFGIAGEYEDALRGIATELNRKLEQKDIKLDSADLQSIEALLYYGTGHTKGYKELAAKIFKELGGKTADDPLVENKGGHFSYDIAEPKIASLMKFIESENKDKIASFLNGEAVNNVKLSRLYGQAQVQKELLKLIHEHNLSHIFSDNENFNDSIAAISKFLLDNRNTAIRSSYPHLFIQVNDNHPNLSRLDEIIGDFGGANNLKSNSYDHYKYANIRSLMELTGIDQNGFDTIKKRAEVLVAANNPGDEGQSKVPKLDEKIFNSLLKKELVSRINEKLSKIQLGLINDPNFEETLKTLRLERSQTNIPISVPSLQRELRALGMNMEYYLGAKNQPTAANKGAFNQINKKTQTIAGMNELANPELYFNSNNHWYDLFNDTNEHNKYYNPSNYLAS